MFHLKWTAFNYLNLIIKIKNIEREELVLSSVLLNYGEKEGK